MKIANNTTIANFWRTCVHASLLLCSTCTVLRKGVTQSTRNECYYLQFAIFIFTHKRQQRTVSLLCNCHAKKRCRQKNTTEYYDIYGGGRGKLSERLRYTYFFSRRPAPVSRNPLANGLLSILSCVIYKRISPFYKSKNNAGKTKLQNKQKIS